MKVAAVFLALVGFASAFVPMAPKGTVSPRLFGYVPDGLTPEQYAQVQAKEKASKAANKKKAMKGSVETLTQFNARMEKKFPNQPGAGHVFVKLKGKALGDKLKPRAAN
eukprot:CAMPEP_0172588858 /NCGR_PEP_ID=MMETSP1068-20121228/7700_1 /TAXON_ID=35684 /ORGANISM="Pseudopedinella elastica, Strain CCMP716" /LENGTH=108 /DNA_ID=CAMNT_0013384313 /DNA_START=32 /DNA_END=358 /DNA_ORIENTATION=-